MRRRSEADGAGFAGRAAWLDESTMRVLLVADRGRLVGELRELLVKSTHCEFLVVPERDPARVAACVRAHAIDLLLLDLALADRGRAALVDLASELATRLPVVLLTGTESLDPAPAPFDLRIHLEEADLPALLVRTLRRARRLGTAPLAPVFCRLDPGIDGAE